jgi:hypothetical protein
VPDYTNGKAFRDWVNVMAPECPSKSYVNSFVLDKIRGTQADCGESAGVRMPASCGPMNDADIQTFVNWVTGGAQM